MELACAATIFPVADVAAAVAHFVEKLGFKEEFNYEGMYAGVVRDDVLIHLSQTGNPNTSEPGKGMIYIFVDDVDAVHADLVGRGATVAGDTMNWPYGMRDFEARDLDGNCLTFGSSTDEQPDVQ